MADTSDPRALLRDLRSTVRTADDRVVAGVCGGLGRRYGVDPMVIRLAVVVLTLANGVGLMAYAAAWALLPGEEDEPAVGVRPTTEPEPRPTADRALAIGLIVMGALLLVAELGLLLPAGLVWSVAASAAGFSLVWARTSDEGRERWMGLARGRTSAPVDSVSRGRVVVLRAIAGGRCS